MSHPLPPVEILLQTPRFAVVNKPHGMMIHRSKMANGDEQYLVDALQSQLRVPIFAVHRLDRATSGCCLVAFDSETASLLGKQVMDNTLDKTYWAVVRGWPREDVFTIDYPLDGGPGKREKKSAVTHFSVLARAELPFPDRDFSVSRYAWLECRLETGRFRQIRRHLKHCFHHLIGDTSHGDGRHNRQWRMMGIHRMLLHARSLSFDDPFEGHRLHVTAPVDDEMRKALAWFVSRPADAPVVMSDARASEHGVASHAVE